ncbi:MAG: CARDB domain-containing protein, partial [Candidatus Nanoarchaeia archaeon]
SPIWNYTDAIVGYVESGPVIADLDENGYAEIIFGTYVTQNVIVLGGLNDLVPLQMNVTPENLTEGQNATINVSIRNNGSTGTNWFNISLLVDGNETSRQEGQLDFYMTQDYTFNWTAVAGSHNLTIVADIDDVINESNETNNNITITVDVGAAAVAECNLSVLIDGINTTSFTNAGEPYNVTVNVTYTNGSAFDTIVNAVECNGLNQFALIQSTDSVVSNCDSAIIQTGSDGIVSWTDVPTGGDYPADSVGNYTISIRALSNGTVCDEKNLTVVNRAPPAASGEKTTNVPNRANVEGSNEQILVIFDRISRSRLSGAVAGETFDIVIYDNGTAVGMPASITSGRPTGLNITILNSTGSGIENVTVNAIEKSGLNHWALIQFGESNVSSEVTGTTSTDSNGNVQFTIVPTAGFVSSEVDAAIGAYSVRLQAILPNGTIIYNNMINVDRTLPQPAATEAVPNAGLIEGFNEKILILFDRVSKYV